MKPGIETLLEAHLTWLQDRRVGLVAHAASVDRQGTHSLQRLLSAGVNVTALFAPEHGWSSDAGAGEAVPHAQWEDRPIWSLYGDTRAPTAEMLENVDVLVFDLQDLGVRSYTYGSTLRYVLEAAARYDKAVVVADRPVPLPLTVDGPMLEPAFESFVGAIPAPLAYGMTPGETARFLANALNLDLDLRISPLADFRRAPRVEWSPWIPPSPAIRSWECAAFYAATVCLEALPIVDHGRGTPLAFQVIAAPWLDALAYMETLFAYLPDGVTAEPITYTAAVGPHQGQTARGVRLRITNPLRFQPVTTGIACLSALCALYGSDALWESEGARPDFFDRLLGTATVRAALMRGADPAKLAADWAGQRVGFMSARLSALLYE